jgi:prepilin-type N-terminal cleavage/methylation domain-containing protein
MSRSARNGFTITEVLVVIAIIATLIAFFVPATRRVREAAARTHINSNLKQVALAIHSYHDVHKQFPPATGTNSLEMTTNLPLSILVLPYVDQLPLYQVYTSGNRALPTPSIPSIPPFQAPLDFTTSDWIGVQNFAANVRVFTDIGVKTSFDSPVPGLDAFHGTCTTNLKDTFTDGTSNTIMFATRYANNGAMSRNGVVNCSACDAPLGEGNSAFFGVAPMTAPASSVSSGGWQLGPSLPQANCQFGAVAHSFGVAGLQAALADASCRTISPTISAFTWNAAMQPNDGNSLGSDW